MKLKNMSGDDKQKFIRIMNFASRTPGNPVLQREKTGKTYDWLDGGPGQYSNQSTSGKSNNSGQGASGQWPYNSGLDGDPGQYSNQSSGNGNNSRQGASVQWPWYNSGLDGGPGQSIGNGNNSCQGASDQWPYNSVLHGGPAQYSNQSSGNGNNRGQGASGQWPWYHYSGGQ